MNIKKVLVTASLALTLAAAGGIVVSANVMADGSPYHFDVVSEVGSPNYSDGAVKNLSGDACVLATYGVPDSADVIFRVRNYKDLSYASDIAVVSQSDMNEVWFDMAYFSGMGIVDNQYRLATTFEPGKYYKGEDYINVKGYWQP